MEFIHFSPFLYPLFRNWLSKESMYENSTWSISHDREELMLDSMGRCVSIHSKNPEPDISNNLFSPPFSFSMFSSQWSLFGCTGSNTNTRGSGRTGMGRNSKFSIGTNITDNFILGEYANDRSIDP